MKDQPVSVFEKVPRTAGGHFVLNLYAAIFRLLNHIRRLTEVGGESLEATVERYPFLGQYFAEMRQHLPEDLTWDDALPWWPQRIAEWENGCATHLPLSTLDEHINITFTNRLAFMITGLVEEDSRFGTLFADLQAPLTCRRPTLELVGQMVAENLHADEAGQIDAWTLCRPLLSAGLLEAPNREAPRSEWVLRVPPLLWDAARGELESRPLPWCHHRAAESFPAIEDLIHPPGLLERLAKIPRLIDAGNLRSVILRADPGSNAVEVLGAVARQLGRGVLAVDLQADNRAEVGRLLGPLATLSGSLPVLAFDLGPGETAEPPPLPGYAGPLGMSLGHEGGIAGPATEKAVTINLASPSAVLRRRYWQRALNGKPWRDAQTVVDRFHFAGHYIDRIAEIAVAEAGLEGRDEVRLEDVRQAGRSLNRQLLDTLAARLSAQGSWDDLIAGDATADKLTELERRCRHRERLLDSLGPAFGNNANRGVRALFTGASGTGKTLAARILAAQVGLDIYRVDLAAIINKYIGETEKNLHRVLTRAESLDVVLLLDEGDALLGQRTEVKSANDRYANLETNYLLQRLENYQGIVLVTTNLGDNIDQAFQRRMDVVVPFFPPKPVERWQIYQSHLPESHGVSERHLERLALRCALNGGQIRNAALHATLMSVEEGCTIADRHITEGVKSEYRKAGGTYPLAPGAGIGRRGGGMESFLAAIEGNE